MTDLTSLQNHIDTINAEREGSGDCFRTCEAQHFFEMYGINTVEAFEEHMDFETYSDWYKDRNGFRPRGVISIDEARRKMDLWAKWEKEEREELALEAELEAKRWAEVQPENRPVNSVMADALISIKAP